MAGGLQISAAEHGERVARVKNEARLRGLDAVIAYGAHRDYQPADLRYLADWCCVEEETACLFVPLDGPTELVTDADWDVERARSEAIADGVSHAPELGPALADLILEWCGSEATIGIAGWRIFPASVYFGVKDRLPDVDLRDASTIVSDLRMVKSRAELAIMREAARVSDAAMEAGLRLVVEGTTEFQVVAAAEQVIRSSSAEVSFVTEMGAGPRTARGAFLPTDHRLCRGEVAVLDCGARVHGYHGDICRTVVVGGVDAGQRAMLEAVASAVRCAIDLARPGTAVGALRSEARRVIGEAGFGEYLWDTLMPHGNGTGQHEPPTATDHPDLLLGEGMVLCMELGLSVPGQGAYSLEQMIAVGRDGAEELNALPLEMWA